MSLSIGIHPGIPEAIYHADPAETPSASSGALRTLLTRSPQHAWHDHARLNPAHEAERSTEAMDRGTILHALVLGTDERFRVLDVPDYRAAAARALRDETIAAGLIPVKINAMEELEDVASAVRERLRNVPEAWKAMQASIKAGLNESTLIWREQGVLCRCRYDMLPPAGFPASFDLKFTGVSAEPEKFGRTILQDYSMQAALYPRAVQSLRGDRPIFVFVAAETEPPYGVSLHALDPEAQAMADEKLDHALRVWRGCLSRNEWPSYSQMIHFHGPKPWEFTAWQERQALAAASEEQAA